jgi:hypothetical protein
MAFAKFKVKKGIKVSNNFYLNSIDAIPVGLILPYGKNTPPNGWLMCDGTSTTGYSELASIVGSTTPDLSGYSIIGNGSGVGNGSSGTGVISGSSIPSVSINTVVSSTNVNQMINFSHTHGMGGHTHSLTHTHNYPHTHSYPHYHADFHGHLTPFSNQPAHTHNGWFTNTISPGTSGKAANGPSPGQAFSTDVSGFHLHPAGGFDSAPSSVSSNGSGWGSPSSVNTFTATATSDTVSDNSNTGSFGSPSSPAGEFPIMQPTTGVYFIIKY